MISKIKKILYFPVASYFRFFAAIRLKRWNPKIVVVTGSNGKTTLLHLIESQIGDKAKYSHHANSSYGIPFDILDLHRKSLLKTEWINLILKTPFNAFKKPPEEKLYIVEADCDRPGEGKFLSELLKPEIVLWISTAKTHSMNFEKLVGRFETVEEAIAHEFGYFIEYAKDTVLIDGDSELMDKQLKRTKVLRSRISLRETKVISVKKGDSFNRYEVGVNGTVFLIENKEYRFKFLLPEEVFYSIEMTRKLCEFLDISFDQSFSNFQMPPGRGSIFKGIKDITIIDSTYNANLSSMKAVLSMFDKFQGENKWLVVSDMLELGKSEKEEHEKLADLLLRFSCQQIILLGPRTMKYTYPKLKSKLNKNRPIETFEKPKEVLDFIRAKIKGEEIILFKGVRFMEGIIEHLLSNKEDIKKLPRRERIWEIRRKQWGL